MVPVGSQCFSVVLVGSHRFSVVLSDCRMFSVVLYGCHGFSKVLVCSHRFINGSHWFSVVLVGFSFLCANRYSRCAISHITH